MRPRGTPVILTSIITLAGLGLTGCAQRGYQRIRLGQPEREYQRVFPESGTHPSTAGFCYLERNVLGRTDAYVVLLTRDRLVSAKFHATHIERSSVLKAETRYRLVGELDPRLLKLGGTGPIDILRVVIDELAQPQRTPVARAAHAWVAAGLARLVQQRLPAGGESAVHQRLADVLECVPGGGTARMAIDERGRYVVEYAWDSGR